MRPSAFTFLRRPINPLIQVAICSGNDSNRSVCPNGAVSKMRRSYCSPASSMMRVNRSNSAASSAPGDTRAISIWRSTAAINRGGVVSAMRAFTSAM